MGANSDDANQVSYFQRQTLRRRIELLGELLWGFFYYPRFERRRLVLAGPGIYIKKVNGAIHLGRVVALGAGMSISLLGEPGRQALLTIGDNTRILPRTHITCLERIAIGADCAISWDVEILDTDGHTILDENRQPKPHIAPVTIEDRVWIGARSIILKGVTIGHDSVIAAGSLVSSSIPPFSLAGGNPAKVIKPVGGWVR